MTDSSHVTLGQFQRLTDLSDRALVELLDRALLPVSVDETGKIKIELGKVDLKRLAEVTADARKEHLSDYRQILIDRFAEIAYESFEGILQEALLDAGKE